MPTGTVGGGIQAYPGAGGTVNIQYSLSSPNTKDANSLQDWAASINDGSTVYGAVTELASSSFSGHVQWVRMTATGNAAKVYISLIK
jgi:hypothetical protein